MVENTEYRLYTFGNFYMSSIQQGIQALHSTTELFLKYSPLDDIQGADLYEWADSHKTVICLNGGMDVNLQETKMLFAQPENPYAWSYFNEAQDAMGGMLTNLAIVLPNTIYETASNLRSKKWILINNTIYNNYNMNGKGYPNQEVLKVTNFDIKLINVLNNSSLAR